MKYIKLILITLLLLGCRAKSNVEEKVCKGKLATYTESITYKAKEDKVSEMVIEKRVEYSRLGYNSESVKKFDESYKGEYEGIKGVEYRSEVKGKELIIRITIKAEEVELLEVTQRGILSVSETEKLKYISLSKSMKVREKSNFICK